MALRGNACVNTNDPDPRAFDLIFFFSLQPQTIRLQRAGGKRMRRPPVPSVLGARMWRYHTVIPPPPLSHLSSLPPSALSAREKCRVCVCARVCVFLYTHTHTNTQEDDFDMELGQFIVTEDCPHCGEQFSTGHRSHLEKCRKNAGKAGGGRGSSSSSSARRGGSSSAGRASRGRSAAASTATRASKGGKARTASKGARSAGSGGRVAEAGKHVRKKEGRQRKLGGHSGDAGEESDDEVFSHDDSESSDEVDSDSLSDGGSGDSLPDSQG